MKSFKGFFQEIYDSIVNFDGYRTWQNQTFGKNLWYLFRLLLLTTLISVLPVFVLLVSQSSKLPKIITQGKQAVATAYPKELVLTIKNGQLSTNVTEPYYYDLPKNLSGETEVTKHLITIATAAQVEDYEKYNTAVLVTKSAVVYPKSGSSQKEVMFLKEIKDGKIDYQNYTKVVRQLDPYWNYIYPIFWVFVVALVLLVPFLGAGLGILGQLFYFIFIGGIVWLLAKAFKVDKSFGQIYRILMHASTLPILFFTALGIIHLVPPVPAAYSLVLGIFSLAICFHIKKSPSDSK
jgi:hypothetical protein